MDFVTWDGTSYDAADSSAADLDDLAAEMTGDHAIIDWYDFELDGYARRFAADASGNEADEPVWVLAAYVMIPGAEEGTYEPRCDPTTVAQCRKLAERLDIGVLLGD